MCLQNSLASMRGRDTHANIKLKALNSEEENLPFHVKYAAHGGLQLTPMHLGNHKYLRPSF